MNLNINTLEHLLRNKNLKLTVRHVLRTRGLSKCVESDNPNLINFFSPRDNCTEEEFQNAHDHLTELVTLALSDKLNRKGKQYADDKTFKFNVNAANVLYGSSTKFHIRLLYMEPKVSPLILEMRKFAMQLKSSSFRYRKKHKIALFVGHFSRIFYKMMIATDGQFIYCFNGMLPFYSYIADLVYLTSIKELYVDLTTSFFNEFTSKGYQLNDEERNDEDVFLILSNNALEYLQKSKHSKPQKKLMKHIYIKNKNDDSTEKLEFYKENLYSKSTDIKALKNKKREKIIKDECFYRALSSVLTIDRILDNGETIKLKCQNPNIIEKLFQLGALAGDNTYLSSKIYQLIVKIIDNKIDEFKPILDKYRPDPNLKEKLVYQIPLYFQDLSIPLCDVFFNSKSDEFCKMYIYGIINNMTKQEREEFLNHNNAFFLRTLCSKLPENVPSKTKSNDTDAYLNDPTQPSKQREPLKGFYWELARFLANTKHCSPNNIPFMKEEEWKSLTIKIKEYNNALCLFGHPDEVSLFPEEQNEEEDES